MGGAVAEVIGRAIADIARHRQVLCITHLPQIAALATRSSSSSKSEAKGRTNSTVRKLREDERIEEIARMIGGVKVGDAARRAAEELRRRERPRRSARWRRCRGAQTAKTVATFSLIRSGFRRSREAPRSRSA